MSGYTSSYRSYDAKKLINGTVTVKADKGKEMYDDVDDDCYITKVEWHYRLEVSG